jgi:hypothetical protein
MKRDPFGTYGETTTLGETVRAFVPPALPPDLSLAAREAVAAPTDILTGR